MSTSVLDSPNPHRLMSLASRIKAKHHAMTAEELADLLNVSRLTILRRAKRGTIPSFRVGSCVRFDPANISKWLMEMGVKDVESLMLMTLESRYGSTDDAGRRGDAANSGLNPASAS